MSRNERKEAYQAFARKELRRFDIRPENLQAQERKLCVIAIESVSEALSRVYERFEQMRGQEQFFEYHNTLHTETVIQDTILILVTIHRQRGTPKDDPTLLEDVFVGMMEAAWHDVVQDYQKEDVELNQGGKAKKRTRKAQMKFGSHGEYITNEHKSAVELNEYIRDQQVSGLSKRTQNLIRPRAIITDIETTIPTFGKYPGSETMTVYQGNLNEHSSLTAKALAFADLASSGWMNSIMYMEDSRRNLREEDLDIYAMVYDDHHIDTTEQTNIILRIRAFFAREIAFIEGRYLAFQNEVHLFGADEDAVRDLYPNFASRSNIDRFIQQVSQDQQRLLQLPFRLLMQNIGYEMGEAGMPGSVTIENELLSGDYPPRQ